MAPHTRDGAVLAGQRKAGGRMVIGLNRFPPRFGVAALAIGSQPAQMLVILFMASGTGGGGVAIFNARLVARHTRRRGVFPA